MIDDDWIVVRFSQEKQVKMCQLTEKVPYLEAKCYRISKISTFRWPVVEDKGLINEYMIFRHLPFPTVNKGGKIVFHVNFFRSIY